MELLKTIWTVYLYFSAGFTTFFLFGLIKHLREKLKEKRTEELIEKVKDHLKVVYVEQVCGVYHLYDKVSNRFIAQGYTEDEMWANAHLTFPKQEFIIEGENGKAILVSIKDKQ